MRHALVLLITLALGPLAHASEVATDDAGSSMLTPDDAVTDSAYAPAAPPARPAAVGEGGLSRADARTIYSGNIPDFVDYDSRMLGDRSRCGYAWGKLRNANIAVRPVRAPYQTIRAKALRAGVSAIDLDRTLATYLKNQNGIPNQRYITVIDFTKRSNTRRMFMIDLTNGDVSAYATSAGESSDSDGDGYATSFSNKREQGYTSLGCYMVYGTYSGGKFGAKNTMMLHGFEPTNDNACARSLIMHPKWYVGQVPGRSNGCFAVHPNDKDEVFSKVAGGLVCAYHDGPTTAPTARVVRHHGRRARHQSARHNHVRRHRFAQTSGVADDAY